MTVSKSIWGIAAAIASLLAYRKLSNLSAARIQKFYNRALLAGAVFRATDVDGMIHQVEFDFIYLDGDRTPGVRRVSGIWTHESDQPEVLCLVPLDKIDACSQWGTYGSYEKMAMLLARKDRSRHSSERAPEQILKVIKESRAACYSVSPAAVGPAEEHQAGLAAAYKRAWDSYPNWPVRGGR